MSDSSTFLVIVIVALLLVLGWVAQLTLSIQKTLRELPVASLSGRVESLQSEQARAASELGRTAATLAQLQTTSTGLHGAISTLAGQAELRAQADTQSREVLRRLELVIAGSFRRGAAGENLLAEVLETLPPGMLERNLRVAGGTVEFAVRLPGGKYIPIDSKWTGVSVLHRLEQTTDPQERSQLVRQLENEVGAKAEEVVKYLDPEKTILLGIAAVPDAVYHLCRTVHSQAYKRGIVLLPYSLAIPYVLSMFVLVSKFGRALDTGRLQSLLAKLDTQLHDLNESLEGHLSRGLTMVTNAVQNHRAGLSECTSLVAAIRGANDFEDSA